MGIQHRLMLCRPNVWHPANAVCLLDNLLHRIHLTVAPVCNWHDRLITGDWTEDEHLTRGHLLRRFRQAFRRSEAVELTRGPDRTQRGPFVETTSASNTATGAVTFTYTANWS